MSEDDDLLHDAETWAQADALLSRPARLEEALALKAHLDEEDRAAERLVAPLLTSQIRFRDAKLAENPKARHAGVVRYLCAAAHERHEKRPPSQPPFPSTPSNPRESAGLQLERALSRASYTPISCSGRTTKSTGKLGERQSGTNVSP